MEEHVRKIEILDADQIKRNVGSLLKRYRERNGYTQIELGELVYHSTNQISRIEKGQNALTIETLFKLCTLYGVTPNTLLGFIDKPEISDIDQKIHLVLSSYTDQEKKKVLQLLVAYKQD